MKNKQILLNKKEVAKYLRMSYSTFWLWVKQGKFPPPNVGTRYSKEYIEEYLKSEKDVQGM